MTPHGISAMRANGKFLMGVLALALLAGCGRKPPAVDPPANAPAGAASRTYPPLDGQ